MGIGAPHVVVQLNNDSHVYECVLEGLVAVVVRPVPSPLLSPFS